MEEIRVTGAKVKSTLKAIIREGNVRRIVLRNPEGRTLIDMPLTAGIAASLLLPLWVTIGSVVAMATDYTILVERDADLPMK